MFEKSVFCIACGTDLPVHAKFCFGCGAPLRPQRRPISEKLRFEVFQRDGFTCQYCGRKPPEVTLHVDHKVPVAKGGSNHSDNLVSSCVECNLGKGVTQLDVEPASQWLDEQERRRKNAELKELRRTQASIKRMEKRFEAEIENLQDPNDFYFPGLNPASPPTRNSVTWYTEALSKMDILIAEWSREASLITNEEELAVIEKHIEALNTKRTGYDNIRNNHNSYIVVEKERKKALAAERKLKREAEELAKKEEAERRGAVEIEQARILASTERRNAAAAARAKKQARQAEIEFEIELARRLEARRSSIGSQIMAAAAKVPEENGFNWCPGPNVQSAGDPLYLPATESESGSNVSYELTPTESSSVFKKLGSRLSRSRSNRSYP